MRFLEQFHGLSRARRYAILACVAWIIVYVGIGGPMAIARFLISRSIVEIVAIQAINSIFSALVITELSRIAIPSWSAWDDQRHFRAVAIWWVVLTAFTTAGVLMMRGSGPIS